MMYDENFLSTILNPSECARVSQMVEVLNKEPLQTRQGWLDDFIKVQLAQGDTAQVSFVDKLFHLTRYLQIVLKLRYPIGDSGDDHPWYHVNKSNPLVKVLSDISEEVLPGSYSLSRKHMEFKLNVFKRIEREHKVILNDEGHPGSNGYGHDVSRLLSLTGSVPRNIGVRPIDNRSQRTEHGLLNKMDPLLLEIARDFLDLLFGVVRARSIRVEAKSQSGLPARMYGRGYKTISFIHAVAHLGEVLQGTRDVRKLNENYDIIFAFLQGSRRSPDASGKKRYITSKAGRDMGLAGDTLQDNHVYVEKVPNALTRWFATMRYRFVWGGNSTSNAIVNCIGTSARELYGQIYGFTFKHHGAEDILSKLALAAGLSANDRVGVDQLDLAVIDVSNFDLNYPKELIRLYIDFFKGTPIYDFFARTAFAPSVQGSLDKDFEAKDGKLEPILNGDLADFNPETYLNSELPSGWSFVSDAGKMMAAAIYFCLVKGGLLDSHSVEQLDLFLKGKLKFSVLNLGDDNVVCGPAGTRSKIYECLNSFCPWVVEPEPGARFIGFPITVDDFGQYNVVHDPASYVTNWLTPERGIKSPFRKFWAVGLKQREGVYNDVPITAAFRKIIMEEWHKVYGTNLDVIINEAAAKQRADLENIESNTDLVAALVKALPDAKQPARAHFIVMRALQDSSVLSWQFSAQDIKDAFDLDINKLEGRPLVSTTEKVLTYSGYELLPSDVECDDYNGNFFIRKGLRDDISSVILNNIGVQKDERFHEFSL